MTSQAMCLVSSTCEVLLGHPVSPIATDLAAGSTTHNAWSQMAHVKQSSQLTEGVMEAVWLHMVTMMNSTPKVLGAYPTSAAVVFATPLGGLVVETTVAP
jgi:hypothetical protein